MIKNMDMGFSRGPIIRNIQAIGKMESSTVKPFSQALKVNLERAYGRMVFELSG